MALVRLEEFELMGQALSGDTAGPYSPHCCISDFHPEPRSRLCPPKKRSITALLSGVEAIDSIGHRAPNESRKPLRAWAFGEIYYPAFIARFRQSDRSLLDGAGIASPPPAPNVC
jgi:hypothetical protein